MVNPAQPAATSRTGPRAVHHHGLAEAIGRLVRWFVVGVINRLWVAAAAAIAAWLLIVAAYILD